MENFSYFKISRKLNEGFEVEYDLIQTKIAQNFGLQVLSTAGLLVGLHIGKLPLRSFPTKVLVQKTEPITIKPHKIITDILRAFNKPKITMVKNYFLLNGWLYVKSDGIFCSTDNSLFLFGWPNTVAGTVLKSTPDVLNYWESFIQTNKLEELCGTFMK